MISAHVPLIASADYETFRTIINEMPKTFAQWQHLRSQNIAKYISNGWQAVNVEVDPHEFARYCHATTVVTNDERPMSAAMERR